MSIDQALEELKRLNTKYKDKSLNEANTRFQIIDKILEKVLFWPKSNILLESHTNEGYTDYQLINASSKTFLVIEAKKEKINFNFSQYKEIKNRKIKVKILLKDENAKKTIIQVKNYCNDIGCNYACITNGHEWAFFRTYIDGKSWRDGDAFIINSLEDFIVNFSYINRYLTYHKIVKEFSLTELFKGIEHVANERYEPKTKINGYREQISNNHLEADLRGYFDRYFGEIRQGDKELLEKCYVSERGYAISFDKVSSLIEDALSPYMLDEVKLKDIRIESDDKNTFSDEILNIVIKEKKSKVLVLFGGKGAGKTTFLVNLFNSDKNKSIREHSIIGYVNLLNVANDKEAIKENILKQLIEKIDKDNLLKGFTYVLEELFKDRFEIELKQSLHGLDPNGEIFLEKKNNLLSEYKKDLMYCLIRLSHYWRGKQKAIIINIDNTDQFDQDLQDYCFSIANELSEKLHCISIISLREERYMSSNINGYLDAYEQNGFHISSPRPQKVFLKRLEFIKEKINNEKKLKESKINEINILFDIFIQNLKDEKSEFNRFMTAATHGNIRQGLDLFKNFVFSNYTNVNEMIKERKWTIKLHQIIKPIMIPTYRYYSETTSNSIPNIFRLRSDKQSSHFTGYRILKMLSLRSDEYVSVHELESYFIDTFNMRDDFLLNIDIFLTRGLIESENGFDKYNDNLQKIKITAFGYYMQEVIFKNFTYLELISSDSQVLDKQIYNEIVSYSNNEYNLIKEGHERGLSESKYNHIKYKRVEIRKKKVKKFAEYLKSQELSEIKFYSLGGNPEISEKILIDLKDQFKKIEKSATRTLKINTDEGTNKHGIRKLKEYN